MAKYTVTPWQHNSDLLSVRQEFYRLNADDVDRRRDAVNRVFAWKLRGGSLPHAVESTALLVNAVLLHSAASADVSLHSIRAVYTAAFTRFVTGFCDIGRARERSLDSRSMLEISRQIGMPAEFVALRHEATHEDLPGIQQLVKATEQSLEWLWNVYWSKLEDAHRHDNNEGHPVSMDERTAVQDRARAHFKTFRRLRREALKRKSFKGAKGSTSDLEKASRDCIQLFTKDSNTLNSVVDVLIDDKFLLPASRTLGASMDGAYLLWNAFLVDVCGRFPAVLDRIVERLLDSLGSAEPLPNDIELPDDVNKEATVLWLEHFAQLPGENLNKDRDFQATSQATTDQIRAKMIKFCCLNPGDWTHRLGESLVATGTRSFIENWGDLFQATKLDNAQDTSHENNGSDGRSCDLAGQSTWTRSILRPTAPIGIV